MNANRDLERRLAEYYTAEGVLSAPDRVLSTALGAIDSASQRRGFARQYALAGGFGGYARLAVALFLVVAATAIVLGVLNAVSSDVGGRPTVIPASASPTARPNEEGSGNFVVPFTYVLPQRADFDYGTRGPTYFEIRVPAAAEAGYPSGVIVQAIGGGRIDPCDADSPYRPLSPGAQAVIDYLRTIPDLTVSDEFPTSVGELPASQAHVTASTERETCHEIWPWAAATEPFTAIPRNVVVRIVALDVGEHVVFTVFGEDSNPGWPELAEELIDSFQFGTPNSQELDRFRLRTPVLEQPSPAIVT